MPPHRSRARGGHHRAGAGGGDRRNGSSVRRDQRTGRTCIPPAALGRIWTPTPPSPTSTPASTSRAFALADVRGPPRGAMGRGGGHPGRPGPAMTQDGPPSVHVSARPVRALSPNGWHRAERGPRSRGRADPPRAAVTRCDREPLLPVIHTLCTCAQSDPRRQPEGSSTAPVVLVLVRLRARVYRAPS